MRKILPSVSFCVLIALLWVSCSKKDISGTITPDKLSSTTSLAAGPQMQSTTSGTTANTTGNTTSATTSGSTTTSTGSTTGSTTLPTPKGLYVIADFNGEAVSLIDNDNVSLFPRNDKYYGGSGQYFEVLFAQFNNTAGPKIGFSLGKLMLPNGNSLPSNVTFNNFFKVKNYNYSTDGYSDAAIFYAADNGDVYNSANATNTSQNSTFSIQSLKDTTYNDGGITRFAVKVKLKFSCSVANNYGDELKFTNGQAALLYINK